MGQLRVGNRTVTVEQAQQWVSAYVSSGLNGWPNYDHYDSRTGQDELAESDLLAPGLLNVGITLAQFPALKARLAALRQALDRVPTNVALVADPDPVHMRVAADDDIATAASAYALLDTDRPPGVLLTTYSKILHRKRPHLLPLYDMNVRRCYCHDFGDTPAVVPTVRGRSYVAFAEQLMHALRADLRQEGWQQVGRPPDMSLLRCLDIVAWHLGRSA